MNDSLPKHKQSLPIDSIKGKKLIPISEAAKVLGVSIDTVRRWDKSGVLHSERPDGKNRYFSLNELEKHKFSQPLPISEVAKNLSISTTTLRRLEARGLIKPKRNNAGERVYDEDLLKNFLNSDYFLRKKQLEEKIFEPSPKEKKPIDDLTRESGAEHFERKDSASNQEISPDPDLKPRSAIPSFIAISAAIFLLLTTLGVRNIKLSEAKSSQTISTLAVLGTTKQVKTEPASTKESTIDAKPREATSEATTKITVRVKTSDSSSKINIRQEPTVSSKKIGEAKDGDNFELVSKVSDWYEIKLADGLSGFISATYILEKINN